MISCSSTLSCSTKATRKPRLALLSAGIPTIPKLTYATAVGTLATLGVMTTTTQAHNSCLPRCSSLDFPRDPLPSTTLVSRASGGSVSSVYRTLGSATRFQILVPSSSRGLSFELSAKHDSGTPAVSPRPLRRSVTTERLGVQTPSSPRAISYTLKRGREGRFSLLSLPELSRPASERLAELQLNEDWNINKKLGARLASVSTFALGHIRTFEHMIAKRILRQKHKSMKPLGLAIHNSIAQIIDLQEHERLRRPSSSVSSRSSKHGSCYRIRHTPALTPLDMDAVRTCKPASLESESPQDRPNQSHQQTSHMICRS